MRRDFGGACVGKMEGAKPLRTAFQIKQEKKSEIKET